MKEKDREIAQLKNQVQSAVVPVQEPETSITTTVSLQSLQIPQQRYPIIPASTSPSTSATTLSMTPPTVPVRVDAIETASTTVPSGPPPHSSAALFGTPPVPEEARDSFYQRVAMELQIYVRSVMRKTGPQSCAKDAIVLPTVRKNARRVTGRSTKGYVP
ncbi:hypothetical protein Pelo_3543 [Pelomyxa schiedti]|nr:hypothetical protein Pelo_3543 [Pelomyxa schiedti]